MKQAKQSNARRDEKTTVVPRLDCLDFRKGLCVLCFVCVYVFFFLGGG